MLFQHKRSILIALTSLVISGTSIGGAVNAEPLTVDAKQYRYPPPDALEQPKKQVTPVRPPNPAVQPRVAPGYPMPYQAQGPINRPPVAPYGAPGPYAPVQNAPMPYGAPMNRPPVAPAPAPMAGPRPMGPAPVPMAGPRPMGPAPVPMTGPRPMGPVAPAPGAAPGTTAPQPMGQAPVTAGPRPMGPGPGVPPPYGNPYNRGPYGGGPYGGGPFGGSPFGGNNFFDNFGFGPFNRNTAPWETWPFGSRDSFWSRKDFPFDNQSPTDWFDPNDPKEGLAIMWEDLISAPDDLGTMPGGWHVPSISTPNPVDLEDQMEEASKEVPDLIRIYQ